MSFQLGCFCYSTPNPTNYNRQQLYLMLAIMAMAIPSILLQNMVNKKQQYDNKQQLYQLPAIIGIFRLLLMQC